MSSPSITARSVRYCPGAKANSAFSSSGIAKPIETLSAVWRRTSATSSAWKRLIETFKYT